MTTTDPFAAPVPAADAKPTKDPRKAAYNAAQTALRAAHQDEYTGLLKAELEKRGLEHKPRLTTEERAAKDHEEALAKARAKAAALVEEFGPAVISGIA